MDQAKILIVDDDLELRELISETLSEYGYLSEGAKDGREMFDWLEKGKFDLVLLDIMMPKEDGLMLCHALRAPGSMYRTIPVIFLTALRNPTDAVVGLEIGGDDYLCKPFQERELIARIRALLRRASLFGDPSTASSAAERTIMESEHGMLRTFGNWKLNEKTHQLIDEAGVVVSLSATEFRLLALLLDHPQQIISRDQIMDHLAVHSLNIYDRSIDAQVSRLRAKLRDRGPNSSLIRTMRGDGYMLTAIVGRSAS